MPTDDESKFLEDWHVATTDAPNGESLASLSRRAPVMVVCLRHGGCPFCRQVLAELAARRAELKAAGIVVVLVHLMNDEEARTLFARFGLEDVPRIADPEGRLYEALGLARASPWKVAGPPAWWEGTKAVLRGHWPGMPRGDVFRLPGTFLIREGRVIRASTGDATHARPDYEAIVGPGT